MAERRRWKELKARRDWNTNETCKPFIIKFPFTANKLGELRLAHVN